MGKFDNLTRYATVFESEKFLEWVNYMLYTDPQDSSVQKPSVSYTSIVCKSMDEVYEFCENHTEYKVKDFIEVLEQNGISWGTESMSEADVTVLDADCVLALMLGAIEAEESCTGAFLEFFENGTIVKWLERLKELEQGKEMLS